MSFRFLLSLAASALLAAPALAQPAGADTANSALRIFLDCNACDDDYVRTETRWAEFVRDRTVADVHVLVTEISTGSGGNEYTIELAGVGRVGSRVDTLRFVTRPTHTLDERRRGLTRVIHLGLGPYVARTPGGASVRVSVDGEDDGEDDERVAPANDPWKAWVFELGVDGSIEREQRQRDSEIGASFEATRVTSLWKAGLEVDAERNETRFELDDRVVNSRRESYGASAGIVRSLGLHWGAGVQASLSSSSFENTRRALRAAPAVEYSVWPYEQATRRQLTLQYSFGVSSFDYREETIFSRIEETRPTQTFVASYDAQQRWGSAEVEFQYSNYADDQKQYRLEFEGNLSIRIARGLSLELGASASQIRDQLSIAKRDATDEEILLELRDLRTDYRFEGSIGFSYTFGSIFNSVVNPRFGGGPGELLR